MADTVLNIIGKHRLQLDSNLLVLWKLNRQTSLKEASALALSSSGLVLLP